jgi:hypothetical protein
MIAPALVRAALVVCALAAGVSAQVAPDARAALTNFPASDAVLYVNVRRITHEAMPRVIPKAEVERMFAEARKVGFDLRDVDYLAAGIRFTEGAPAGSFPEVLLVLRGRFSADALLTLARIAASTKSLTPREETYGGKAIQIFDLSPLEKAPEPEGEQAASQSGGGNGGTGEGHGVGQGQGSGQGPKPRPLPFKEVAGVALDANTLVVGVPGYVRAAVDAAGGRGSLDTSLVGLAAHDAQALWSVTARLPENLPQYVQKLGLPQNEEATRIMGWLKQVSVSNGMDALNFTLRAAVLADSPEHASAISGLVRMGLTMAESAALSDIERKRRKPAESRQSRMALDAIRKFINRTEGSTVILGGSIPQRHVAEFVQKEFIKKPAPAPGRRRPARRR